MEEAKYIYCIIELDRSQSFGPSGIGARGDEIYTICFNDLAAVVSDSPQTKYQVSRENTMAHEKAIELVMNQHPVLPVRFATVADGQEKVKKILEKEHDRFKGLLDEIKDKKEFGLKAVFKEGIYKELLEEYQELKTLKHQIASRPPEQTYYQRIEIGKMVEQALEGEKDRYRQEILDCLSPLAQDVKINQTYGERMIINAAFLVQKKVEREFDLKVDGLDKRFGDKIKFKYVGTIPPFNFVNLVINLQDY